MSDRPVRWGVMGAATFARKHMARAIHAAEGAQLVALATSTPEKALGFQAFAPGLRLHDDYNALLADPDIDAVYIPLPNHLHVSWALQAAEAGKHVLCEKPIAMRANEIDALIATRDRTGLVMAEAYMIAHHPQWHKVRDLVQSGAIGDLRHVTACFTYDNSADTQNIRNKPDTGGGSLPDIGVYTIGGARFVTGAEPQRVRAVRIERENGIDTTTEFMADFPGFTFSSLTSMRMFPHQSAFFHGDRGAVRLTAPFNPNVFGEAQVHLSRPDQGIETFRWPGVNHYVLQVEAFCRAVQNGETYPWALEDARGTQAAIDAVFEADQN